jgi:general secretion pathway protein E
VRCRGTGYYGRTAVFEIVSANSEVRELINRGAGLEEILASARRTGTRTLREAAVRKLARGLTSFEEVVRMTAS